MRSFWRSSSSRSVLGVGAFEVSYISGGVGAGMREELLAKEKKCNLKIVVAEKSGDYLAAYRS
jgi:hypothetical protein